MKMTSGILLTLVLASASPPVASVEFTVLNRWGINHSYRVLHFRLSSTSPDLAPSFHNLAATKIPYGIYDYELVPAPGDTSVERLSGSVDVNRDQIHITNVLETADSVGHRAQLRVSGILEPRPKTSAPVWVILQNVYGKFRDESTVDDRGGFQFHHVWGNNVIIVCVGSEVLMSAPLSVGPNDLINQLHIDLKTGRINTRLNR